MAENKQDTVNARQYRLNGIYVKDISFENPGAPGVFLRSPQKPEMNIGVDVTMAKVADNAYEVALKVNAEAKVEGKVLFIAEVVHAGLFTINPELSQEEHDRILLTDCAATIFPFARKVIGSLVQDGGFPQLLLEPINFEAVYLSRRNQAA